MKKTMDLANYSALVALTRSGSVNLANLCLFLAHLFYFAWQNYVYLNVSKIVGLNFS